MDKQVKQFDKKVSNHLDDNKSYAEYYEQAANYYAQIDSYDAYANLLAQENTDRLLKFFPHDVAINKILDFGCGNSLILKLLFHKLKAKTAIGIDVSPFQLSLARQDFPQGEYLVGDEQVLKTIDGKVDLVLLNDILEHLKEPQKILSMVQEKTKYIAIVQILEKTKWRKLLSWLKLKEMKSRYYDSIGHLQIWDENDFFSLLKKNGLQIVAYKITNYSNELLFHDYVMEQMKIKKGILSSIKFIIYKFLNILPKKLSNLILNEINGNFIYCLCRVDYGK
ncbi:class I SAM-dependent methyltransferase [candidate division KSB1 bacterium]|nr:class I SAM-dependent methyltransferase [candidate division KSB1 bacterium]